MSLEKVQWKNIQLGNLLKIQNGYAFSSKQFSVSAGMQLIRIRDLKNGRFTETKYVGEYENKYVVKAGDLLIGMDGEFQCYEWIGEDSLLNQRVCKIHSFGPDIISKFVYYGINNFLKEIESNTTFTTVKHLSSKDIQGISFPVPSVAEQKRIVAILDDAIERIDTAIVNTEKNIANARELFNSCLSNMFSTHGDGWSKLKLGDIGTITSSKRIFKHEYIAAGIPFYRTKEIKQKANGNAITTELFISIEKYDEIKIKFGVPKPGDILLTAIGTIGELYVVDDNEPFYFKDGNVLWLKDFSCVDSNFLKYALMSFVKTLNLISHGSAYNALPIERLKKHLIPVPPLDKQKEIVAFLDGIKEDGYAIELNCNFKCTYLNELKQSLLQKAFSGELTTDFNPDALEH